MPAPGRNPEVVDEHVDPGEGVDDGLYALGRRDVGGDALDRRPGRLVAESRDGLLDALGAAAVDPRRRTRAGEAGGDDVADALGRAADERGPAGEVDLHGGERRTPLGSDYARTMSGAVCSFVASSVHPDQTAATARSESGCATVTDCL